jgi:hypothetical protein
MTECGPGDTIGENLVSSTPVSLRARSELLGDCGWLGGDNNAGGCTTALRR